MRKCAVLGCPNCKFYCRDKTFFKFPLKNEELLQVWLKNIGRRSFKPSTSSIVCSDHFLESSYDVCPFTKRKKLKQGSFPINFNQPPKPRPHCVLLSTTTNGNYPQLDESKRFIPGAVPSVSLNPPTNSFQPLNYSENLQDKGKIRIPRLQTPSQQEQQCVQISIIQPPNEQLKSQNPNCVPVLLNNSMFILPLNVNQPPKAHSTYENCRSRKRCLQTAVPSISRRLAPKPDINAKKLESQASSGTESQNVAETSVVINQEPVVAINQEPAKSADKPPMLVIKKTATSSSIKLLPSTSSSFISLSTSSSSSSYGSAPFPENPLPLAYPNSANVAKRSLNIKQEPAETAAAPLPDFVHSTPTNIVEMSIDIKQEPVESVAAPLTDSFLPDMLTSACPSSSNVAEMSIGIKEEPIEAAAAFLPDMSRSSNSTNVAEASIAIKQEPIEYVAVPLSECILSDFNCPSSTNANDMSTAIKREPDGSVDESPQLVSKKIHLAEEMTSFSKNFSPTISSSYSISSSTSSSSPSINSSYSSSPSTSNSSSSCSSAAPSPQTALPSDSSDSTSVDEPPAHIPNKPTKKRIIFLKAPGRDAAEAKRCLLTKSSIPSKPAVTSKKSAEGISRTSQADLCWRTLMSMASKNSEVSSPKKSGGPSSELVNKSGENVSKEMLQSLLDVSESNPSFVSRSTERTGDLFDVFADFVAEKLRRMDLDDCAHALRAIVDIVSEPGEVKQNNKG